MSDNGEREGQQLGNYRLTQLIGRGNFADVYRGQHIHLNTQAAIKVLHGQLTDNDLANFIHELAPASPTGNTSRARNDSALCATNR